MNARERKLLTDWAGLARDRLAVAGATDSLIVAVEAYVRESERLLREVASVYYGGVPMAQWHDWQKRIAALLGPAES